VIFGGFYGQPEKLPEIENLDFGNSAWWLAAQAGTCHARISELS
jgi:hypothetical protein